MIVLGFMDDDLLALGMEITSYFVFLSRFLSRFAYV